MEQEFLAIKALLDRSAVPYQVTEHEPVFTSDDAARVRGEALATGVKALIFKADEDFVLILVPGDKRADLAKLRAVLGKRNIRMASADEVLKISGCEIGSVHPFGPLMGPGLPVYMEQTILSNPHVNFNAGLHTMSVRMSPKDLQKIINAPIVDLMKES